MNIMNEDMVKKEKLNQAEKLGLGIGIIIAVPLLILQHLAIALIVVVLTGIGVASIENWKKQMGIK